MTLRELHLFAGIGGGILGGMLLGHRCVGAVEIDPYCRRVLEARQRDGVLEPFPIHDDIRTFDARPWRGRVDVVCGGFPCQPWSVAGKRKGAADERHLWPEMARIVAECRPAFVFAENVSLAAFAEPWRDLRGLGYRVPPALCLGASHVGAPHRRLRWWLLAADADCDGGWLQQVGGGEREEVADAGDYGSEKRLANANSERLEIWRPQRGNGETQCEAAVGDGVGHADRLRQLQPQRREPEQRRRPGNAGWWATEPRVGGALDGFSSWLVGSQWLRKAHELYLAHGNAAQEDLNQALRILPSTYGKEALSEWRDGASAAIPRSAVLLAFLRQLASKRCVADATLAREEAQEVSMRGVRPETVAARSSLRRRPAKQPADELADALHALPQILARIADQAWASYRRSDACPAVHWESGVDRVATGTPYRVDRLRGLGNAQVPLQAATAFAELMHRLEVA